MKLLAHTLAPSPRSHQTDAAPAFRRADRTRLRWLLCALLPALAAPASAQNTVAATVQTMSGALTVDRAGDNRAAWSALTPRGAIYTNDIVATGANAKSTLLFRDGSQLRLNGGTTIQVTPHAPIGKGKSVLFRVLKGQVWAHLRPQNAVWTRSAIAGVRGTIFLLEVGADEATTLRVVDGTVEFWNEMGDVSVEQGKASTARIGQAPSAPVVMGNAALLVEWTFDLERAAIPREKKWTKLSAAQLPAAIAQRRETATREPQNVNARRDLGDALFEARDFEAALNEYQACGTERDTLLRLGYTLLELGRIDEAKAAFSDALTDAPAAPGLTNVAFEPGLPHEVAADDLLQNAAWTPKREDVSALTGLATLELAHNRPEAAIRAGRRAVEADAQSVEARVALGIAQMRQPGESSLDEAARTFEAALQGDGDASDRYQARAWLSLVRLAQGESNSALEEATQAVESAPDSALARGNLALVLFSAGKTREAEAEALRALKLSPDSVAANCVLGQALLARGDVDAANEAAARAVALDPALPQAHFLLGVSDAARRDYRHAVQELRQAVRLAPDYLPATNALARVYTSMGRRAEAVKLLQDVAPEHQDAAPVQAALGLVDFEGKDYNKAAARFGKALQATPDSALYHAAQANALLYANRLNEAISAAREAVRLAPRVAQYQTMLGLAYARSRSTTLAERHFREALRLDPQNGLALVQLAMLQKGGDARIGQGSVSQGFLFDPAVSEWLLPGGVRLELSPSTRNGGEHGLQIVARDSIADGKVHFFGFLERGASMQDEQGHTSGLTGYVTYTPDARTTLFAGVKHGGERHEGGVSSFSESSNARSDYDGLSLALRRRVGSENHLWLGLYAHHTDETTQTFGKTARSAMPQLQSNVRAVVPEMRFDWKLGSRSDRPSTLTFGAAMSSSNKKLDQVQNFAVAGRALVGSNDLNSKLLYAQWNGRPTPKLSVAAGLRWQSLDDEEITLRNGGRRQTGLVVTNQTAAHLLPQLLASYEASRDTTLRFSFNHRATEVTASQFAPNDTVVATEDAALPFGQIKRTGVVRLAQLDLDHRFSSRDFGRVFLFHSSASQLLAGSGDLLGSGGGADGFSSGLLLNKWQATGVGARYERQLNSNLFATAGLAWRRTHVSSAGIAADAFNGGAAPYEPNLLGSLELHYVDPTGNKALLRLRHAGSFFETNSTAPGAPLSRSLFGAQTYVDLRLAKEPSASVEFFVDVTNLFDTPTRLEGGSTVGRRLELGATRRF